MKKFFALMLLFCAFSALSAEEGSLSDEKNFYVMPKIGFGIDFDGRQGFPDTIELKNKFGFSVGLDLDFVVFRNSDGTLLLGLGTGFQYWVPTSAQEFESYYAPCDSDTCAMRMHYMRIPIMFNFSYEFNINTDILTAFAPKLSLGFNNNIFVFNFEDFEEEYENDVKDGLGKYKCSFAWGLGLNFIFKEKYLFIATIGGDVGKDDVQYYNKSPKSENTLYGHHEFFTMEFGIRL